MIPASDDTWPRLYRSGEAAKLAKMPVATLRIWERRYGVVAPPKSDSGQRRYSEPDVHRLALLRRLVQRGHPIGAIAKLEHAQLEQLAARALDIGRSEQDSTAAARPVDLTLAVCGALVAQRVRDAASERKEAGIARVIDYASLESAAAHCASGSADALLVSVASLHEDVAAQILSLAEALQARAIAVVYAYGTGRVAQMLRLAGVQLYREPAGRLDLRQLFGALCTAARSERAMLRDALWARAARRFDEAVLAALSARSSTIACECPRHLAELVLKLAAFEAYSDECRARTEKDGLLHRHLGDIANRSLVLFESALAHIAREEGWLSGPRET